jgi:hypothetical protein
MRVFGREFPSINEIIPVFATIIFPIYSWTIYRLLWNLPSWLKDLFSISDMLILTAYGLAFALFESVIILGFMIFLSVVLPARYLKDKFIAQGSAMLWMVFILAVTAQYSMALLFFNWTLWEFYIYMTAIVVICILMITVLPRVLIYRFEKLENFFVSLADKMTIFLFIYLPVGILSLIVVILRNI